MTKKDNCNKYITNIDEICAFVEEKNIPPGKLEPELIAAMMVCNPFKITLLKDLLDLEMKIDINRYQDVKEDT